MIQQTQGKANKAITNYREAIKRQPKYAMAYANLAYIYRKQGKPGMAERHYLKAVKYSPNIPDIHYNLGLTVQDLNKHDQAVDYIKKRFNLNLIIMMPFLVQRVF